MSVTVHDRLICPTHLEYLVPKVGGFSGGFTVRPGKDNCYKGHFHADLLGCPSPGCPVEVIKASAHECFCDQGADLDAVRDENERINREIQRSNIQASLLESRSRNVEKQGRRKPSSLDKFW